MKIREAPDVVKITEMCRDWWIYYRWETIIEAGQSEPQYLKRGLRPIEESIVAVAEFDTWISGRKV